MRSRSALWVIRLLASLVLVAAPAAMLNAQSYVPTAQELDQLLAPVALYPDALLAQITTASTNPQEILDAEDWLHQNSGLQGDVLANAAQAHGFDPAFVALVNFPQVLAMMAQNIDDYAAIGAAFDANPDSVMDSVQRLRDLAYNSGALRSSPHQQVVVESYGGRQIIEIQPANQQVVYVPIYNPAVVYSRVGLAPSLITFGAGIGLTWGIGHPWAWTGWGWNWRTRSLLYNRLIWRARYNRYRPPHPIYRPRPPNYHNRPVIRPRPTRPSRPNRPGRPSIQPVRPGRPSIQPVRPAPGRPTIQPVRPNPGRPSIQPVRPAPGEPTIQPMRPARPQPRPSNGVRPAPVPSRPRPGPPPANGTRPAPQPRPQPRPQPKPGTTPRPTPKPRPQPKPAPQQQPN